MKEVGGRYIHTQRDLNTSSLQTTGKIQIHPIVLATKSFVIGIKGNVKLHCFQIEYIIFNSHNQNNSLLLILPRQQLSPYPVSSH